MIYANLVIPRIRAPNTKGLSVIVSQDQPNSFVTTAKLRQAAYLIASN
ncbi:MAG TPA: hypothetical protein VFF30_11745 [Nitrososphaerales archaeon]|nr:hypothetical protein [Nitrososphaerales archaeon]